MQTTSAPPLICFINPNPPQVADEKALEAVSQDRDRLLELHWSALKLSLKSGLEIELGELAAIEPLIWDICECSHCRGRGRNRPQKEVVQRVSEILQRSCDEKQQ